MCKRCQGIKHAALEMMAAHCPTLATTVAQRVAFDDLWETFLAIYNLQGTNESVNERGTQLSSDLWDRLETGISVADLDDMRVALRAIREAAQVALTQIKGVLEFKVVNKGQTEGLEPELVQEIHQEVMKAALAALAGATGRDPKDFKVVDMRSTQDLTPHPFAKPTNTVH